MSEALKKQNEREEWWGWSLPRTRQIITSFDHLAVLLGPEERAWRPSHPNKVEGEIRPRTKNLQYIFRSVMLFNANTAQMNEIRILVQAMERTIEKFLRSAAVRILLADVEEGLVNGNGLGSGIGRFGGGGAALRRRRAALHGAVRLHLVDQMKGLESSIGPSLIQVENVLWPPRIIKLGGSPTVNEERTGKTSWIARLDYFLDGIVEAARDVWDVVVDVVESLVARFWKSR